MLKLNHADNRPADRDGGCPNEMWHNLRRNRHASDGGFEVREADRQAKVARIALRTTDTKFGGEPPKLRHEMTGTFNNRYFVAQSEILAVCPKC